MIIYIDLFLIFNMIMDMIIIIGTSLVLNRRTKPYLIVISSILGGLSSLLLFTEIPKVSISLITIIILSMISFGYKDIFYTLKNTFYMYLISTLLGGIMYLFNVKVSSNIILSYLIMIVISIEVVTLYVKESKKLRNNYNNYYKVNIYFKDKEVKTYTGFYDSGNNLYDPYNHRPIVLLKDKIEGSFILVPYHTLSGDGLLKCFKVEYIEVNNNKYSNVLVGISNTSFPDGVEVILHKDLMKG